MNKKIIKEPASDIRRLARQALGGFWKTTVLAALVMQLVMLLPDITITYFFPSGATPSIMSLYALLVGAPLMLGFNRMIINIVRKRQGGQPLDVFNGFEYIGKAVGLRLLVGLYTFLWSMLFIMPVAVVAVATGFVPLVFLAFIPAGVIYYRYSLAPFVLADSPQKGVVQCIAESKFLSMGNKMQMFKLDISFIGWTILCMIPAMIATGIFMSQMDMGGGYGEGATEFMASGISNVTITLTALGLIFLTPYMTASGVLLYDMISGKLVVRRGPGEAEIQSEVQQEQGGEPVSLQKPQPTVETAEGEEAEEGEEDASEQEGNH